MSENTETDISPVVETYEAWKNIEGVSELGQGLHPGVINHLDWEGDMPKKIAEFVLSKDRQGVLDWLADRKSLYRLEQDKYYERVHEVRREIRKILRREKFKGFGG